VENDTTPQNSSITTSTGYTYKTHIVEGANGSFDYIDMYTQFYQRHTTTNTFILFGTAGSHVFPVGSAHHVTKAYKVELCPVVYPSSTEESPIVDSFTEPRKFTIHSRDGAYDDDLETNNDNEPRAVCTSSSAFIKQLPFITGFKGVDRCANLVDKETFHFFAFSSKLLGAPCAGAIRVVCEADHVKGKRILTDLSEGYKLFKQLYLMDK